MKIKGPETVEELRILLEAAYPTTDGFYAHHCQTGEPYVTLGTVQGQTTPIPGTVPEGARRERYDDEAHACAAAYGAFRKYSDWWHAHNPRLGPILYWRHAAPRIFWYPEDKVCHLRIALSAAPIRWQTMEQYDLWRRADLKSRVLSGLVQEAVH